VAKSCLFCFSGRKRFHTCWGRIEFHIEGLREDSDPVPEVFESDYVLVYKWDVENLMDYYKGIFVIRKKVQSQVRLAHSRKRKVQLFSKKILNKM